MTRNRSGLPVSSWYLRTILIAHSFASAPEFVKNIVSANVLSTSRWASRSPSGMRQRLETCQTFLACSVSAFTRCGWL
ncbi:hypothetical protein D3C83_141890 [compost metagenome]